MLHKLLSLFMFAAILGGCAFTQASESQTPLQAVEAKILAPIEKKLASDFVEAQAIGAIVNKPEIVQCSAYLQGVVDSLRNSDAILKKLQAEDTRGLVISSILKDYFTAKLELQSKQQAIGDFEKQFPTQCGVVQTMVAMEIFKKAVFGMSLGRLR